MESRQEGSPGEKCLALGLEFIPRTQARRTRKQEAHPLKEGHGASPLQLDVQNGG